jgi:signal transduction histidine kinase
MSLVQQIAPSRIPPGASTRRHAPPGASNASRACCGGERACRLAWERVRGLPPGFWRNLPSAAPDDDDGLDAELMLAAGASAVPYHAIARASERALSWGISRASAPALVLLSALAYERYGGGAAALQLAETVRQWSAPGVRRPPCAAHILHATLIAPIGGALPQAIALLNAPRRDGIAGQLGALCLAGTAFAAGMPLAELSRHLEQARRLPVAQADARAARELAARAELVRSLLSPQTAPQGLGDGGSHVRPDGRFGEWLTRLQAAWYAGQPDLGMQAANRAAILAGPLTPLADLMSYHLFAALTLSAARATAAFEGLRRHAHALDLLAERCPAGAGAMADLAGALLDQRAGDAAAALCGFERAAASATGRGQHWVAALACEQAARQALESGLAGAAGHYRGQALVHYAGWGALGRAAFLRRTWRQPGPAAAHDGEQQRIQRADAIGDLGVSIAHEVNQPLAAIALHAEAARKWLRRTEPDIDRALASLALISAAGRQAGDIVRSVHRLAARQEIEVGEVAVDAAVTEALQLLHGLLREHGVEVELALGLGSAVIRANGVQLQQVVTNLVVNAIEALAGAPAAAGARRIRIGSRRYNGQEIEIAVADNGPGIAPCNRAHVFARLFSTKPDSTGMGLCISLAIARAHGGDLVFEPREPHGACFRLRLPAGRDIPSSGLARNA